MEDENPLALGEFGSAALGGAGIYCQGISYLALYLGSLWTWGTVVHHVAQWL